MPTNYRRKAPVIPSPFELRFAIPLLAVIAVILLAVGVSSEEARGMGMDIDMGTANAGDTAAIQFPDP